MLSEKDYESPCSNSYRLEYSIDNGDNWLPVDNNEVSDTCSYDWIVPVADSNQCLLSIRDVGYPSCDWEPMCWISLRDTTDDPFAIYECPENLTGDLDGNCYIDFHDLNVLGLRWHTEPSFQTLAELADQWCDCSNPYDPACAY
jgi:hypothetical protein